MSSQSYLLERIGSLAVEYVRAWDEYHRVVTEEFVRGVARECVVSQVDPAWRDVTRARVALEADARAFMDGQTQQK